jgi:predicted alpha/beta hydrolase
VSRQKEFRCRSHAQCVTKAVLSNFLHHAITRFSAAGLSFVSVLSSMEQVCVVQSPGGHIFATFTGKASVSDLFLGAGWHGLLKRSKNRHFAPLTGLF